MQKLTPRIYVESGYMGSSVGCIDTGKGLVTVDAPVLPGEVDDWKAKLSGIGGGEVLYAVITDFHFDHGLTAGLICERVVAHKIARAGIKVMMRDRERLMAWFFGEEYVRNKAFFDGLETTLPQVLFTDQLELDIGGRLIALNHVGGHTAATVMVHVPSEKVVFLGDNLTNGEFPFTGDGKFADWINVLGRVEQMDVEVIVPGHGEPCDKGAARLLRAYFEDLREQVLTHRRDGLSRDQSMTGIQITPSIPDWKPLPGFDLAKQVTTDAGRMYDQMEKGLL